MNRFAALAAMVVAVGLTTTASAEPPRSFGLTLEAYGYPFPVTYLDLELQRQHLKMAFMDVQPATPNGKAVVLLHGKNFSGAYFGRVARDLAARGYRVVIPDQIGFGKSSKPDHFQYSFQQLARNTLAVLDELGVKKASVLGHSMGGMLATRFALMFPERVEALILENPIGLEDWKLKVPYQPVDAAYRQELAQSAASIREYQLHSYYGGKWKPEYDEWVNLLASFTLSPEYPRMAWNQALTSEMVFTQPVLYEFDKLTVPTLLIIGQRDRTAIGKNLVGEQVRATMGQYPALGRAAAKKIPKSTLVELDDVGHLPHIEAYDRFLGPLIRFLEPKQP